MDLLSGIWRLVQSKAWTESGETLDAPYGSHPLGQIVFSDGRMLAALYNGDLTSEINGHRSFSSYGGLYQFDGSTLRVSVDVASDPTRIGGIQVRKVIVPSENRMILLPPTRLYGNVIERRELTWERVWTPNQNVCSEPTTFQERK